MRKMSHLPTKNSLFYIFEGNRKLSCHLEALLAYLDVDRGFSSKVKRQKTLYLDSRPHC